MFYYYNIIKEAFIHFGYKVIKRFFSILNIGKCQITVRRTFLLIPRGGTIRPCLGKK